MLSIVFSRHRFSRAAPANNNGRRVFILGRGWIDYPIRILATVFFAFAATAYFRSALHKIDWAHLHAAQTVDAVSVAAVGIYMFMLACLYIIRLKPINKFAGFVPAAVAIIGCYLVSGLLFLPPRLDLPMAAKLSALGLIIGGNLFTAYALRWLGRSFSILPEGRRLVTTGPYRAIRNPVYLGEAIATLGVMINFLSLWAVLIVAAQFALQLARIRYEERVLAETFPEYAAYARRTARLIPGLF
jgi:protein-S-isoprenylcysteine O-methyltransferase Ste14